MTDCQKPELQDLLPDYLAGTLDGASVASVKAHIANCGSCAEDLALLRTVRALSPHRSTISSERVASIVAALPKSVGAQNAAPHPMRPMLVKSGSESQTVLPPSTRKPSRVDRRRAWGESRVWRIAATVVVMLAGGASLMVARKGGMSFTGAQHSQQVAVAESLAAGGQSVLDGSSLASAPDVTVSYGDIGDYSEEELQAMIDRIDNWDGQTSIDPLPGVPLVPSGGTGGGI